jgi:hypothetical protein
VSATAVYVDTAGAGGARPRHAGGCAIIEDTTLGGAPGDVLRAPRAPISRQESHSCVLLADGRLLVPRRGALLRAPRGGVNR